MDQVQNPVTYLDRGDPASGAPVLQTAATAFAAQQMADRNDLSDATGTPFEAASHFASVTDLASDGTHGDGNFTETFGPDQFITTTDGKHAYYEGGHWFEGEMPRRSAIVPGDVFGSNAAFTGAESPAGSGLNAVDAAADVNRLLSLGHAPKDRQNAFGSGEKVTIGGEDFHWDGSAWVAGAA